MLIVAKAKAPSFLYSKEASTIPGGGIYP